MKFCVNGACDPFPSYFQSLRRFGLILGCGDSIRNDYKLVRWPDGLINRQAIELVQGRGTIVVIPDVRALQASGPLVSGIADWKYLDGFYRSAAGALLTNDFWFVLDTRKSYPKCLRIWTKEELWAAWCASHGAPTNTISTEEFITTQSSKAGGALRL